MDHVLRHLRRDPESKDALYIATTIDHHDTSRLRSPEPVTERQRASALLAPIMVQCSDCERFWIPQFTVNSWSPRGASVFIYGGGGMQCRDCWYTRCLTCMRKARGRSYAAPVGMPKIYANSGPCPEDGCNGRFTTIVLPTGRHDVTPMNPESIEAVIVTRDGPIAPTTDQALSVVTRRLPLIDDDAALIHVRRSVPGKMKGESTRERLARSLVYALERDGALGPGAWARSKRELASAGNATDTDYLVTVVQKSERPTTTGRLASLPRRRGVPRRAPMYTYLFQVRKFDGRWAFLRDPSRSEAVIPEHIGLIHALESELPEVGADIIHRSGVGDNRKRRVVFWKGDATKQGLDTNEALGFIADDSRVLHPITSLELPASAEEITRRLGTGDYRKRRVVVREGDTAKGGIPALLDLGGGFLQPSTPVIVTAEPLQAPSPPAAKPAIARASGGSPTLRPDAVPPSAAAAPLPGLAQFDSVAAASMQHAASLVRAGRLGTHTALLAVAKVHVLGRWDRIWLHCACSPEDIVRQLSLHDPMDHLRETWNGIQLTATCADALRTAMRISTRRGSPISPGCLVLGLIANPNSAASRALGVGTTIAHKELLGLINEELLG